METQSHSKSYTDSPNDKEGDSLTGNHHGLNTNVLRTATAPSFLAAVTTTALPTVTIKATDAAAGEKNAGETANPGVFTLTRTGDRTQALTVSCTVAGTASNGTDYTSIPNITFAAEAATAKININVTNDTLVETSETVKLTLNAGTGYALGKTKAATVTIADNDVIVKPTIGVSASDANATEPNDKGTFTFTRSGDISTALDVNNG